MGKKTEQKAFSGKTRVSTMDIRKRWKQRREDPDTSCYVDLTTALKDREQSGKEGESYLQNTDAGPRKETESEGGLGMAGNKLQI